MNVRMKCGGCGDTYSTGVPLCPTCSAREISGKADGIVGWVPYAMVPVRAGPFFSVADRDAWFQNIHKTHPELVGRRVDCLEEVVPEAVLRRLDG